jgi:hypothetical protein
MFEVGRGISGLVDNQQRPEYRRSIFCNQVQLQQFPERIPVRYVVAQAMTVEQVRERVAIFNPLSVFVAEVREYFVSLFSAEVAFLQSHYLARPA